MSVFLGVIGFGVFVTFAVTIINAIMGWLVRVMP